MHYHILLTERCNSQCTYCYDKSLKDAELENNLGKKFKFDFSAPDTTTVEINKLRKFLCKDREAVLIFYGGEPLLEIPRIIEIIECLKDLDIRFRMQTNAKLLNKLPIDYLKKIEKILVSIDGDKERTDLNKGKGTFDLIIKNLREVRDKGYSGEIVARMTLESPYAFDIHEQVKNLLDLDIFDSIHWQIDAGFYKHDFNKRNFSKFVEKYNNSIEDLINHWIQEMKINKRVLRLYPFIAITESLLKDEKTKLRCGAGYSGYAIDTRGKIIACPIMNCIVDFEAGDLDSNPDQLRKFSVSGECSRCNYLDLCGGRCLYWNKAELWPKEGNELICKTVKHLIDELKKRLPEIRNMIDNNVLNEKSFSYEKYFGPEIIP